MMDGLSGSLIPLVFGLFAVLILVAYKANATDWGHLALNLLDGLLRLFIRRFHRFSYTPVPLPQQGPALLVANHISGLDPFLMLAACRRPVRFLIAREQYERFGLHWLFKAAGCIPVERNGRSETSFRAAIAALQAGEVIGLFPGGGIHLGPVRLKRGVARLAHLTGAPVYPVHISGVTARGHTLLAVVVPGKACLESYPPLDCSDIEEQACLDHLAEILNKNSNMTT